MTEPRWMWDVYLPWWWTLSIGLVTSTVSLVLVAAILPGPQRTWMGRLLPELVWLGFIAGCVIVALVMACVGARLILDGVGKLLQGND